MSSQDTIWGFPAATVNAFDAAYKASQPPAIQALMMMDGSNLPDGTNPKYNVGIQLAMKGYAVDKEIMIWGWDPYARMWGRGGDGPSNKAMNLTTPDITGQVQLIVSTDPADFPPFQGPVPVVDPAATYIDRPYSVAYIGAPWYPTKQTITDNLPDGTTLSFKGHSFRLHVTSAQTGLQAGAGSQLIFVWIQLTD